jgi:glycosyltransferase involved in cell wall biosynthesis
MRVAVVTAFPRNPGAPHGGVEAVSVTLARALARLDGLHVDVVTMHRDAAGVTTEQWEGCTIHRLPSVGKRVLSSVLGEDAVRLKAYVAGLSPDVVHAHDVFGAMLKGLAIPRVFTVHGFIYGDTLVSGGFMPRLRSAIWKWVEVRGWADQDRIISISPYVRERLSLLVGGRIHDIDNPVHEGFFDLPRLDNGRTLFTASVINQRKNVLALVEAVRRLRDCGTAVELRIAGPITDEGYGRAVKDAIARHQLEESITLLGAVPAAAIREELTRASAFVLVSLEENSPMGIEEAMAAGVPVVTSNRCGMPYMVVDGETGYLVDPMDAGEICDALQNVLADADGRRRMGERARRAAEERFHPDSVARRTRVVYERALAARRLTTAA